MPDAPDPFPITQYTPSTTPPTGFGVSTFDPSSTPPASFGSGLTPLADIAALKAVVTADLAVDPLIVLQVLSDDEGEVMQAWTLGEGDDADDVENGVARPDDYADETNEKVWRRTL